MHAALGVLRDVIREAPCRRVSSRCVVPHASCKMVVVDVALHDSSYVIAGATSTEGAGVFGPHEVKSACPVNDARLKAVTLTRA